VSDNPITRLFWAALTGPKGTLGRIAAESFRELSGTALETIGSTMRTGRAPERTPDYSAGESDNTRDTERPPR
jgi:hypothetical protein